MRTIARKISIAVSTIALFLMIGSSNVQAQQGNVSFQIFYDQLSPYGEWIDDPNYGYIWLPDVGQGFQPYATNGHWVNTQYGNTWYSNYDWGWAPFHYGRWVSSAYGWAWVPGYEWGPAWVSWRQGGGQYGWAPLGPGMNFSVNINIPLLNWIFVPQRYFFNDNIYRYYTPHNRYNSFYNRTTIINNVYVYNNHNYYSGPDRRSLEQNTRSRVNVREIQNSTRPGRSSINNRSVNMYRPNISTAGNKNARPTKVVSADKVTARPSVNATRPGTNVRPERGNTATNGNPTNATTRPARTQANGTSPERNSNARPSRESTRPSANTTEPQRTAPVATQRPSRNATPQQAPTIKQNETKAPATRATERPTRTPTPQQAPKAQNNAAPRTERATPTRETPTRTTAPAATRPATQNRSTSEQRSAPRANTSSRNTAHAPTSRNNESKAAQHSNNRSARPSRGN